MIGAQVGLEAVGRTGQRQSEHARVVDEHVDVVDLVGELPDAGEVGQVELRTSTSPDIDAAASRPWSRSARDGHFMAGGRHRGRGRLADTAVSARDDDPHLAVPSSADDL